MICTLSTIIVPWSRIPWPPSPLPVLARPHRHPTVLGLPPPSLPHYCPAVLGPVATQPRHPLLLHAARPLSLVAQPPLKVASQPPPGPTATRGLPPSPYSPKHAASSMTQPGRPERTPPWQLTSIAAPDLHCRLTQARRLLYDAASLAREDTAAATDLHCWPHFFFAHKLKHYGTYAYQVFHHDMEFEAYATVG
jgi:hypothetical protein